MDEKQLLFVSTKNGVASIVFNHAPANAYDLHFHNQFNVALAQVEENEQVRVVVIKSSLEKFFCAGADIKKFQTSSLSDKKDMVAAARSALAKIESSKKIFIAALNGHTLGGGLEIALACDLRFASNKNFLLGLPEVKLGLLPGNGGSQRLPRLVGVSKALELLITGDSISPEEAFRIGLVNQLFDPQELEEATQAFAEKVAKGAPLAIAAVKKSVNNSIHLPLEQGLALEDRLVDELYETADAAEGFTAFVEKREPIYQGV